MEALAKRELFCFEKAVIKIGILVVAVAVFSGNNMLMKTYANIGVLKGYIVNNSMSEEQNNALFLLSEKWQGELKEKYNEKEIKILQNGVAFVRLNKTINSRKIKVNVAEINRSVNPNIEILPQLSNNKLHSKSLIKNIVKENHILAINGTYFKQDTGTPLGALIINNEIITGPIYERVGLGIGENDFSTARLNFNGSLKVGFEKIKIDNINQPRMLFSQVLIYTNKWGEKSPISKSKCKHIAIKDNKITAISNYPLIIPENGYVITGSEEVLGHLKLGKKVSIDYKIAPNLNNAKHIISGGPYLMKQGEIYIDTKAQKLNGITGRNPRTAIGYTKDNVMIMVVIEGRKEGSSGVTLNELANIMKDLGCYEAINLDGGSSTSMYLEGKTYLGTKTPTRISNALIVQNKNPI